MGEAVMLQDGISTPAMSPAEYLETDDTKPGSCRRAGLDCGTCVGQTARGLAGLCPNLTDGQLEATFKRVYPDGCCQETLPEFERAYRELSAGEEPEAALLDLLPA